MEIVDALAPRAGEPVIRKRWYDAFAGSELDGVLRARHVTSLVVVGTMTDICVLSTVVGAFNREYRITVVEDGVSTYRYVLERHGPENIVVGGRSAGGNIAVATLLRARDEGLPLPAGLVLLSPQVDLTESGDSFATLQLIDVVLPGTLKSSNLLYANGADLADPRVSPLFADLTGFPPTFLQSGTRDLFLSNTVRMHRALRRAGASAELHVFEGMPHGGFGGATPEDRELLEEIARFVERRWKR